MDAETADAIKGDYGKMVDVLNETDHVPFTKQMSYRDLCAVNARVQFSDCEQRCGHRWRHWKIPGRPAACHAACRSILHSDLAACKALPKDHVQCPYNQPCDDSKVAHDTAADGPVSRPSSFVPIQTLPSSSSSSDGSVMEWTLLVVSLLIGVVVVMRMS